MSYDIDGWEYMSRKGVEKPKPPFKQCTYLQESQGSYNLSHYLL